MSRCCVYIKQMVEFMSRRRVQIKQDNTRLAASNNGRACRWWSCRLFLWTTTCWNESIQQFAQKCCSLVSALALAVFLRNAGIRFTWFHFQCFEQCVGTSKQRLETAVLHWTGDQRCTPEYKLQDHSRDKNTKQMFTFDPSRWDLQRTSLKQNPG